MRRQATCMLSGACFQAAKSPDKTQVVRHIIKCTSLNRPVKLLQDLVHAAEFLQLKPQTTQLQLGFEP